MNSTQLQLKVTGLLAFKDNYIWMIGKQDNKHVVVVDPGDEKPVISAVEQSHLTLAGILITHHHWDHTQGVSALEHRYKIPVFWAKERIAGEKITFPALSLTFEVLKIPGHTLDHVAYYGHGALFCGDTLFTGGCGRLFEGTAAQLYQSLTDLMHLPEKTLVYCGHEYTTDNLNFAQKVEPQNRDLLKRMQWVTSQRIQQLPTVPATLAEEKKTNPFLRCHIASVTEAVEKHTGQKCHDPVTTFALLRQWKDKETV